MITILDLMRDPELFGDQFGHETWDAWRSLLAAFYGLPMSRRQLATYNALTGRQQPSERFSELWQVIGRRGGKTQIAALLAVYEACFIDHRPRLSPGEVATVMCLAADRKQSRTLMRYVSGLLNSNPMLKALIVKEDRESIELSNRSVIEIGTASFRAVRGYTLAAVLADEIAFWRSDESANPDAEIIQALRPALATLEGPLIAFSSPYAKRGELWRNYRKHYGKESSVLVAQAPTRVMNPSLPKRIIAEAYDRDPLAAAAEYDAQFRSDVESFVDAAVLESLTRENPMVLPPESSKGYSAFVDPSGGGADGFSLSIAHRKRERVVIDLVTERTRISPSAVVREYADILKQYRIRRVTGDRYAGSWVQNEFQRCGVQYNYSPKNRSELYTDTLAMLNAGQVELPPDVKLARQFSSLERKTTRAGRDSIDHPPGQHDDLANACAGVIVSLHRDPQEITPMFTRCAAL